MTTQKKTRSAVGAAAAGENTSKLSEENNMNSTQDTTTPEHSATDVAEALQLIDMGDVHCIDLEPRDALYLDIPESIRRPVSWLGSKAVEGAWVHVAQPIDASGRNTDTEDGWWTAIAANDPAVVRYWRARPNTAIRVGDYLVISHGEYTPFGPVDENGEIELVTLEELRERTAAKKEAWTAEYAEAIAAAMPPGATAWDVWDFADWSDAQGVMYEHEIGPVTIAWPAEGVNGVVRLTGPMEVTVRVGNMSDVVNGADELRELASAIMAAIPVVEEATA